MRNMERIVKISQLVRVFPTEHWSWDETGEICLDDISIAIHEAVPEISEPYGDMWRYPALEQKSREWHIGRIIYFINRPSEIKGIVIEVNRIKSSNSLQYSILDGWHRYAAARWLYDQGEMIEINCILEGGKYELERGSLDFNN